MTDSEVKREDIDEDEKRRGKRGGEDWGEKSVGRSQKLVKTPSFRVEMQE